MVFFVCEGCNETLKKNQVDKHASRCRVCEAVTCVDCSVTFYGNDYAAHTVCVSEAEKYEKSLYKGPKTTKANPQDEWNAIIESAVASPTAPPALRNHLTRIGALDNIPRNQKKFANFVKNSVRIFDDKTINELFIYISSFKPAQPPASSTTAATSSAPAKAVQDSKSTANNNDEDASESASKDKKKKKKRSKDEGGDDSTGPPAAEETTPDDAVSNDDERKSQKKKKRKNEDREENDTENTEEKVVVGGDDTTDDTPQEKKQKKEKKNKRDKQNC
jgi:cell growth-regulating nucleolar protein